MLTDSDIKKLKEPLAIELLRKRNPKLLKMIERHDRWIKQIAEKIGVELKA